MQQSYQFYGKSPDPDLKKMRTEEPINLAEYRQNELRSFGDVFRKEVRDTVRNSRKWFSDGIYQNLSPQFEAFDHLKEMFKNAKFELQSIMRASDKKDEALYRVQVRVPVLSVFYNKLFKEPTPPGTTGHVLISFHTGVCREFVSLGKREELIDLLKKATRSAKGDKEPDPAFDPINIIPAFLQHNRLEARYNYLKSEERFGYTCLFQSPEGFIYKIEIDGYSALTGENDVVNLPNPTI